MAGCGTGAESGSTLPQSGQSGEQTVRGTSGSTPGTDPPIEPATLANLATHVELRARALAARPYLPADTTLPAGLAELDYDAYRSIRFRSEAALWRGGRFEVQFAHPGFLFAQPVQVNVVGVDGAVPVGFSPTLFHYGDASAEVVDPDALASAVGLGFAGFRVLYPLNQPDRWDEVVSFQGASYFRLVGHGQVYGLSSRGLAIDVASGRVEEFPDFTEFWLEVPSPEDTTLVVHALLNSPSVAGAYRFELSPGVRASMEVDARIFARSDVAKLGIAPLSSMFLYGPDGAGSFDDFRPRVHDSEGLMALTGSGEWIWRPLSNGNGLRVSQLRDIDPQGFGLVQRTRGFEEYLDTEAQYHRRPSEWVHIEGGDWGTGGVELLEIPSPSEFNDNIAAYWVPDEPLRAGEERRYRYRLILFDDLLAEQSLAHVTRSRSGAGNLPGEAREDTELERLFVVDFEGLGPEMRQEAPIEANLEASAGEISDVRVEALPSGTGWRVAFRVAPDRDRPADMRLYLEQSGEPVSETWTYVWYPTESTPDR